MPNYNSFDGLNRFNGLNRQVGFNRFNGFNNSSPTTMTPVLPLDAIPGSVGAYSVRKLRAAYAGSALRVRRSSDNTEMDIGFVNNNLDTATLLTFVGAGSGFVSVLYDQSGNSRDFAQAIGANQPSLVVSGVLNAQAGRPTLIFDGTNDCFLGNAAANDTVRDRAAFTFAMAHSLNAINGSVAPVFFFFSTGTNTAGARTDYLAQPNGGGVASARTMVARTADANTPVSRNTPATYSGAFNLYVGTLNYISKDTVQRRNAVQTDAFNMASLVSGNTANTASLMSNIGALNNSQQYAPMNFSELIFWPSVLNSTALATIEPDIMSYYTIV